jgi:hypothetical protein
MPQIPAPEIGSRPDSRVGRDATPDIEAVTQPFQGAANALEGGAGQLEKLQQQADDATAKAKAMADNVATTLKRGEFARFAGDKLSGYMAQAADTTVPPEQRPAFEDIPELLRKDLQEKTDGDAKATQLPGLPLAYAQETNKQLLSAQSLAQRGLVKQAQNNLRALAQGAVQTATQAGTPAGLNLAIAQMKNDVGENAKNLHAAPDELLHKTGHDMVMGYVANGLLKNPAGVGEFLAQSKGAHRAFLSGAEVAGEQKKAEHAFLAYGETQRVQLLKELSDSGARDYELKESGDLTPALARSMNAADIAKGQAIQANPNIPPKEKAKQAAMLERGIETRTWLSELPITPGRIDRDTRMETAVKVRDDFKALGKNPTKSVQDLDALGELRHDLAAAEKAGAVPATFASTVHTALTQMTGKSLAKAKGDNGYNFGPLGFYGTSRQFGNRYLDAQASKDGPFGELSPDKQVEAFTSYHAKYNNAAKQLPGGSVSNDAARQFAQEALMEASARAPGAKP